MNVRQISRLFTGLALGCGVYVALLLTQYFSAAGLPRFRIESFFMWFVALGVAAICLRATDDAVGRPDVDRVLHPAHLKWLFVIFAAVAIVEYRAALSVGFLSDDFVLATWAANRELVHASATGFVRPVVPFVWTILSALPGSIPRNVHIANILLTVGAAAPLQEAGIAALNVPHTYYDQLAAAYRRRRNRLLEILERHHFTCYKPDGAYYIMTDIKVFGFADDVEFARYLVKEIGVATVPGSSFYRNPALGRTKVRFCFCKKDETLNEADRRLAKLVPIGIQVH